MPHARYRVRAFFLFAPGGRLARPLAIDCSILVPRKPRCASLSYKGMSWALRINSCLNFHLILTYLS